MTTSVITLDAMRATLQTETGVRFQNNSFFLNQVLDGFRQNSWALKTEADQKKAIYALANCVAKFASARVDFTKDFDKLDVVFRGGVPAISMRTELLPRLLSRRGYIYNDFFVGIAPQSNARFVERMTDTGRRVVIFDDDNTATPKITVDNVLNGNIDRFAIRISIGHNPNDMMDFWTIVPVEEVINASNKSEKGWFKIAKEKVPDQYGKTKFVRTVTNQRNTDPDAPWNAFPSEMIKKTCMRRLQKIITETFPELSDTTDLLESADHYEEPQRVVHDDVPATSDTAQPDEKIATFDWDNPTPDQVDAINAAYATYKTNPAILLADLDKIRADFPNPDTPESRAAARNDIIARHFTTLFIFRKAKRWQTEKPELMADFGWLIS